MPDTGDPANDFHFPNAPPDLASPLTTGAAAGAAGIADLANDSTLLSAIELAGGQFDMADAMLMPTPDESGLEGDWFIPYDGPGGINDITAALMIDAMTGVIDEATWIDPNDPTQLPFSLAELESMFLAQQAGAMLTDNSVPEPSSIVLIALGAAGCGIFVRRRRIALTA